MVRALLISLSSRRYLLPLSSAAEMLASLLRAVVLVRLLPPDQFGIAIALALVLSLAEIAADIGLDRQMVRLKLDGDLAAQRGTLHALALVKGVLLGIMLAILASPLAFMFGAPESTPAFLALAICPILKGASHLGVKELARDYRFGPDALAIIILHLVTFIIVIVLGLLVAQAWVVSVALIAGYAAYLAATHALAPARWSLHWSPPIAREALRYGAPLMPNGIAQGLKNVGDRLIVGALLGPATLGLYSVTAMIGIMPRGIILRYLSTVFMPRFVNTGTGLRAAPLTAAFAILLGALATLLGLGLWSLGKPVVGLMFGAAYEPSQSLIGAVAIMVVLKLLFATVSLPAIAFGATSLILYGSAGSITGITLGAVCLWIRPDLVLFVYAVALCDAAALIAALMVGGGRLGLRARPVLIATLGPIAVLFGLVLFIGEVTATIWIRVAIALCISMFLIGATVFLLGRSGMPPMTLLANLRATPPSRSDHRPEGDAPL
jgi:O-antigen/teichoic acid export membrane protein